MKVEKVNNHKVKITLSFEELQTRDITLEDLENNSDKARALFLDLITESNLESSFIFEHSQLYIEATADNSDSFVVTITKIEDFSDLSKYDILNTTSLQELKSNFEKNLHSNIYVFNSLKDIYICANIIKNTKCFSGKNSIYTNNNTFYLVFSKYSTKNIKFSKTNSILCEYSENEFNSDLLTSLILEKYTLVSSNNALKTILNTDL